MARNSTSKHKENIDPSSDHRPRTKSKRLAEATDNAKEAEAARVSKARRKAERAEKRARRKEADALVEHPTDSEEVKWLKGKQNYSDLDC